jgi:hypothetical protein
MIWAGLGKKCAPSPTLSQSVFGIQVLHCYHLSNLKVDSSNMNWLSVKNIYSNRPNPCIFAFNETPRKSDRKNIVQE